MQLHRKVEQLVPGLANRLGERVTNLGNEDQTGRGMWHTAGTADPAADDINLIPSILEQAEALDAVGFGYKLLDEGNHLFPWKAMDAVEHNRVGTQLGGQVLLAFGSGVGEQVVFQQLQTESAVGAAGDVAVGIDSANLRFDGGKQLRGNQVCFIDDRQMTVAQLQANHLYILNLLHEVVRINQADDALHLIVLGKQGAVWSGFFLFQDVLDMDGVGQTGNFDEHHLRLTLLHKVERAHNGVFTAAALQRAIFQVLDRDVLLAHQVVAFKDAWLGKDYANLFVWVLFEDAQQSGGFSRTDKSGQTVQRNQFFTHQVGPPIFYGNPSLWQ